MWDIKDFVCLVGSTVEGFHLNNVGYKDVEEFRLTYKTYQFHLNNVGYKVAFPECFPTVQERFHLNNVGYKGASQQGL